MQRILGQSFCIKTSRGVWWRNTISNDRHVRTFLAMAPREEVLMKPCRGGKSYNPKYPSPKTTRRYALL